MLFKIIVICFLCFQAQGDEDEYKDTGGSDPIADGNSIEDTLVTVTYNGEVLPFHVNPTDRDLKGEAPIRRIPKTRVVGGKKSNLGAVPYIVSIHNNGRHYCGGSIYNSRTVLSAAHCFHKGQKQYSKTDLLRLDIVAGDFDKQEDDGTEQRRKVIGLEIYPTYNNSMNINDIAILTVADPFEYNEYVQPIPVDKPPVIPEEVGTAMISGWGYTARKERNGGSNPIYYPVALQEANVHIFSREECYGFYGTQKYLKPYCDAGLICAGMESGSVDTCQGDSGGPLACYNPKKRNRRYLCGIVATGVGCGLAGFPGLYTRVSDFHDWVIGHAGYADVRTVDDARDSISK